jgi:hypothetical protein
MCGSLEQEVFVIQTVRRYSMSAVLDTADTTEARTWLLALKQDISKVEHGITRTNMDGREHRTSWCEAKRQVTKKELARVKELAKLFIVEPMSSGCGFNFGVFFYEHPPVPGVKPEPVFFIDGKYLPGENGQRFEGAWKELSPLSHNKENKRLLKHYGMGEALEKSHYQY